MPVYVKTYSHRWMNTDLVIRLKALKALENIIPALQKEGVIEILAHSFEWESIPQNIRGKLMGQIKRGEINRTLEEAGLI